MADFAAWFLRDDYQRIRKIMDDGYKMPLTFDEWEKTAKRQMADAAKLGFTINPIILNSEEFAAFCRNKKIPRGSKERALFAIERGRAKDMN